MKEEKTFSDADWGLVLCLIFVIFLTAGVCNFVYEVFAGIYHLLDKLIDKI